MKLSGILAACGFLICGAAVLYFVMSFFSNDDGKGTAMILSFLVFVNGLIAVGVAELLNTKIVREKTLS